MKYFLNTDGGSRGNPGEAAIGIVIRSEKGEALKKYGQAIGRATNNQAEYQALVFGLKKLKQLFGKDEMKQAQVEARLDSELVVKHLNHQYKIEDADLQPLFLQVWNLTLDFGGVKFIAVPRERNKEADKLVNEALDKKQGNLL
ncbi:MAG: ribonuclease HI family protein [Candidatus Portnoybacteria bacterium]|jgi:ribonuclease HI|nr:ribonuclease HI family protein [Candidatus Portnoybacteria bacterium]